MLGVGLLQTNDFDGATIKFKNVKAGPRLPDAQARLSEIPKLKADFANKAAAGQQAEKDMETKFNGAVTSFTAGDIPGAKANFQSVNGKHASEAQDYLGKIKNYEAKMNEAGIYASNNDYQSAKKSYTDAAVALGFQPQVVKDKIAELNKLSAANVAPNVPVSNTGNVSTGAKPNVPSAPIIDIGALLAEAQKYMDKKDYSKARQKIVAVLKADIRNKEARDMNDELNKLQPASANTGDEDPILGIYIGQYYKGNYDDAEAALRQYTIASPKKPGLANFYLGLTIVTKYFLGGSSDTERDPKLLNDAKRKFKAAKDVQGFVPPEKLVSPKILQIYKQS